MKRKDFIRYLHLHGCERFARRRESFVAAKFGAEQRSAVPRHTEVRDNLVKKICKDLGIPSAK